MTDFVQITTTTGTHEDAERIAQELVARRLAGCVQVSGPITSIYRWNGELERAAEFLCVIKTSRAQVAAIRSLLAEIHPYDLPEFIATPIVDGSEAYLKWLGEQLPSQ